jgi:hypothetical protein
MGSATRLANTAQPCLRSRGDAERGRGERESGRGSRLARPDSTATHGLDVPAGIEGGEAVDQLTAETMLRELDRFVGEWRMTATSRGNSGLAELATSVPWIATGKCVVPRVRNT